MLPCCSTLARQRIQSYVLYQSVLVGLRFRARVRDLLRVFSESCIWYESGTTSKSKLGFCGDSVEPIIAI